MYGAFSKPFLCKCPIHACRSFVVHLDRCAYVFIVVVVTIAAAAVAVATDVVVVVLDLSNGLMYFE